MRKFLSLFIAFCLIAIFMPARIARAAATLTVNTTADEFGTGSGCSLREAISSSNSQANFGGCVASGTYDSNPSVINIPAGEYTAPNLSVTRPLTLNGVGSDTTIIQAAALPNTTTSRIFDFSTSGSSAINNVTLRNAGTDTSFSNQEGLAIYNIGAGSVALIGDTKITGMNSPSNNTRSIIHNPAGGTITIAGDTQITDNNSTVLSSEGTLNIIDSASFVNNTLIGGVYSPININGNVVFRKNQQVFNLATGGTINGATFEANGPALEGGVIQTGSGVLTITNSRFLNNSATQGGVFRVESQLNISNSLFVGNRAFVSGGVFVNVFTSSAINVTGSRFINNVAASGGSVSYQDQGTAQFTNSCFVGNNGVTLKNSGRAGLSYSATGNWWGAADGPSGVAPGSGDAVEANTTYSGFLTAAPSSCRTDTVGTFKDGVFSLRNSNTVGAPDITVAFGSSGDLPVTGDWNGDGIDTVGVYKPDTGIVYLRNSNTAGAPDYGFVFGNPGDTPLAGKWDRTMSGDSVGVYRDSNGILYLRRSLDTGFSDYFMILGNPGDAGIAGDWNADGYDSVGVFRPSNTRFYLSNVNGNGITFSDVDFVFYPAAGGIPFAGDWTGGGQSGAAWLIDSTMHLRYQLYDGGASKTFAYGTTGARPVAGKWTGVAPAPIMSAPRPVNGVLVLPGADTSGDDPVDSAD
jgi:CSLREA domain-containing protein